MNRIAIVGMSCRLPGADSPQALWEMISCGKQAIREVPSSRWNAQQFYDSDPQRPGTMYTMRGGFLDHIELFDAACFGIAPREAIHMDPQQRLMLELAWEVFEDAGIPHHQLAGSATGVYLGFGVMEYALTQLRHPELIDAYTNTGYFPSIISNRVSYVFDLRGPSLSLDTACSSSLVAVHLACESLRKGESDLALAGGVSLMVDPTTTIAFCKLSALSPNGRCKTFDAAADGYVRGEGAGVVLLKRLEDALVDGDRIYAVILGEAVNQDGKSNGLTAPNRIAQEQVLRQAYINAARSPGDVQYIEAHGTGTFLGDPIEMHAIGNVMRHGRSLDQPLLVGSLKTNIGHLEAAAGIAGLIKLAKCIEHGTLPPHLNFENPNPHIPFEALQTRVVTDLRPWPASDGARLAGISAFGFGGTNAHVVLGQASSRDQSELNGAETKASDLLLISARDPEALKQLGERYVRFLEDAPTDLSLKTICQAAAWRRSHFEFRTTIVAEDCASAAKSLEQKLKSLGKPRKAAAQPKIAFLFTGQGAQFVGMGKELYQKEPLFRDIIDACDQQLFALLGESLRDLVFSDPAGKNRLQQTAYTQPALFALQWALVELWKSWGIEPQVVMGHSIGELAAACTAGVLTWDAGLGFAAQRGALMQSLSSHGGMLAILESRQQVLQFIDEYGLDLSIAASNGPRHTVVSGSWDQIQRAAALAKSQGLVAIRLEVSHAFHSSLMEPILDELEQVAAGIPWSPARISLITNLTGELLPANATLSAAYFRAHARSEVRFHDSLASLLDGSPTLCVEIGPGTTLVDIARRSADFNGVTWASSMRHGGDSYATMLSTLGLAYEHGVRIQMRNRFGAKPSYIDLPRYPFQRKKYWESIPSHTAKGEQAAATVSAIASTPQPPRHPLLGSRLDCPLKSFQQTISYDQPTWLVDHQVAGLVVFPGAAYVEMAMSALACDTSINISDCMSLRHVCFLQPLILTPSASSQLHCTEVDEHITIAHKSLQGDHDKAVQSATWRTLCTAQVSAPDSLPGRWSEPIDIAAQLAACPDHLDSAALYEKLESVGLCYGTSFKRVARIWSTAEEAWGEICLAQEMIDGSMYFSPQALDACLQVVACLFTTDQQPRHLSYVPKSIDFIRLKRLAVDRFMCRVRGVNTCETTHEYTADIEIFLPDGTQIGELRTLRLAPSGLDTLKVSAKHQDISWKTDWIAVEKNEFAPKLSAGETYVLVTDEPDKVEGLRDLLLQEACHCLMLSTADRELWRSTLTQAARFCPADKAVTMVVAINLEPAVVATNSTWQEVIKNCEWLHTCLQASLHAQIPLRWMLLTRGALAGEIGHGRVDLAGHTAAGWLRSIRLEYPQWSCDHFDLDPAVDLDKQWSRLVCELGDSNRSLEVAWRDGRSWVRKLSPWKSEQQSELPLGTAPATNHALGLTARGSLDNLSYGAQPRAIPQPDEIEIRVHGTGLNFRDVLNVLGMYPGDAGPLGGECSGVVSAIGHQVTRWRVGDQVAAIAAGSFAHYVTTHASLAAQKPEHLSYAEAAGLPIVSATAAIALKHFGQIKRGERVLIHAAAGGVGLAAVRIALHAEAQVFATAGSEKKRAWLRSLGVRYVANSRSPEFAAEIAEATRNSGIDIVLNSLTGEFIPKSLSLLVSGGRFVEIGKLGTWSHTQIAAAFPHVQYAQFDLAEWAARDPEWVGKVLSAELLTYDQLQDRPQVTRFPMNRVREAFRTMSQGRHLGKLVITQPTKNPDSERSLFHHQSTYLITGGLGAIGRQLVTWMIRHGARNIDLILHRELRTHERRVLDMWEQQGVRVNLHCIDATDYSAVESVINAIDSTSVTLDGVFHLAGVLRDGLASDSNWIDFSQVIRAKSLIAWNLHQALESRELRYFVVFSSVAAEFGSPGQANYAAANAFLNGLALARHREGLHGLAIQWGPWAGKGMADQFAQRGQHSGVLLLQPDKAFAELEKLLRSQEYLTSVVELDREQFVSSLGAYLPQSLAESLSALPTTVESRDVWSRLQVWQDRFSAATAATRLSVIVEFIESIALEILGLPIETRLDHRQPLRELGLDSLMAVEMRNLLIAVTKLPLDTTVLFDHPTIEALAGFIARSYRVEAVDGRSANVLPYGPGAGSSPDTSSASTTDLANELKKELELLRLSEGH